MKLRLPVATWPSLSNNCCESCCGPAGASRDPQMSPPSPWWWWDRLLPAVPTRLFCRSSQGHRVVGRQASTGSGGRGVSWVSATVVGGLLCALYLWCHFPSAVGLCAGPGDSICVNTALSADGAMFCQSSAALPGDPIWPSQPPPQQDQSCSHVTEGKLSPREGSSLPVT